MAESNITARLTIQRLIIAACLLVAGHLWGQQGNAGALVLPAGEESLWRQQMDAFHRLYEEATLPAPIKRIVLPWEDAKAVALALPLGEMENDEALRSLFLDTLAALLPRIEVLAYHHRLDNRLLGAFLQRLESDHRTAPYLDRLILESSDAYSIWIRDFGPQFAIGEGGELVLLDPNTVDPQAQRDLLFQVKSSQNPIDQHLRMVEELSNLRGIEGSDRIPALMAAKIEARWSQKTVLARPSFFLQGGDLLPVSEDSALVSALTLRANGGKADYFRNELRDYYKIDRTVFLENLPGKTIEHLDFIVQPIRSNVAVVAEVPSDFSDTSSYHRYLKHELEGRFARNEAILRREFPDLKIVKVAMPPPVLDSEETVRFELFLRALQQFILEERIALRFDPEEVMRNPDRFTLDPRVAAKLEQVTGTQDWTQVGSRKRIVEHYLKRSIEELLSEHVEAQVNYRSYVNSLYVKPKGERDFVLIPKYKPLNEDEELLLPNLERQVSQAYQQACPGAEQIWIDCSSLTEFLGVIHCFTLVIPALH